MLWGYFSGERSLGWAASLVTSDLYVCITVREMMPFLMSASAAADGTRGIVSPYHDSSVWLARAKREHEGRAFWAYRAPRCGRSA